MRSNPNISNEPVSAVLFLHYCERWAGSPVVIWIDLKYTDES